MMVNAYFIKFTNSVISTDSPAIWNYTLHFIMKFSETSVKLNSIITNGVHYICEIYKLVLFGNFSGDT